MIAIAVKAVLWAALFWGVYRLFLARETFFRFNRCYLAVAALGALVLPVVTVRYVLEVAIPAPQSVPPGMAADTPNPLPILETQTSILEWLPVIYGIVVAFMIGRWLWQRYAIRQIVRACGYVQCDGYRLVDMPSGTPFSFGRYIFVSPCAPRELDIIIAHESAHICEWHRADLMLARMLCILQWFNPFARLLLAEIRRNHEYLADRKVLAQGYSHASYKAALLNHALGVPVFSLGHTLSGKTNLKRYVMMNRKNSSNLRKLAALIIIPAAAVVLTAFAEPRYVVAETETAGMQPSSPEEQTVTYSSEITVAAPSGTAKPASGDKDREAEKTIHVTSVKNVPSSETENPIIVTGIKSVPHRVTVHPGMMNDSLRLVVSPSLDSIFLKDRPSGEVPILILNGKEVDFNRALSLDAKKVSEMTLLKNETATAIYGQRAKNGVVVIRMKSDAEGASIDEGKEGETTAPEFAGGRVEKFQMWVAKNIRYPQKAMENGIMGKVSAEFTVGADGKVGDVKVVSDTDEILNAEVIRVVESSPEWKPAMKDGVAVPTRLTICAMNFRLQ